MKTPSRLSDRLKIVLVESPTGAGDSSVAAEMLAEGDTAPSDALIFDDEGRLVYAPPSQPAPDKPGEPKLQG